MANQDSAAEPLHPSPDRSPSPVQQDSESRGKQKSKNNSKSSPELIKILVIVAAVLGLIALILSAWASYLWWHWPWCITAPGLSLAIAAIILVFACSDHEEAALCCACIAIILNACAFIWCAVEIGLCHSYQGPLQPGNWHTVSKNIDSKKHDVDKAYEYYGYKYLCNGRCYDWGFEAEVLSKKMDCKREVEQWFIDKYLKDFVSCTTSHYPGVDTYIESPIYQTHVDRQMARHVEYAPNEEKDLAKDLDDFCADYDDQKFVEKRNKCDQKLEDKFEPKCKPKYGGWLFTKGKFEEIKKKDACEKEDDQHTDVYNEGIWKKIGIQFKADVKKLDKNYGAFRCVAKKETILGIPGIPGRRETTTTTSHDSDPFYDSGFGKR